MRPFARLALFLVGAGLLQSGCGSGGPLVQQLNNILPLYQVLDLNTGVLEPRATLDDLNTNSAYTTTRMVFRQIPAHSVAVGGVQRFTAEVDEPGSVSSPKAYMAVFEVTQAQWMLLAGTGAAQNVGRPWELVPTTVVDASAYAPPNAGPAFAITQQNAQDVLLAASARFGHQVDLPTNAQWETSCRAGSSGSFCWGNTVTGASTYAVVAETAPGLTGPVSVATKAANGLGLYDMHGNVWEWTREGQIRGGSWRDTLPQSRSGNRVTIDPVTRHALVGLRLVLVP